MPLNQVVVIGAGPAGSALATLLARRGVQTILFDQGKRPDLIVGESLIPSVVPLLRELGIEGEVRSYATLKPGASFYLRPEDETTIMFADVKRATSTYSYNVPRDRFDASLLNAARNAGAYIINQRAQIEIDPDSGKLRLSESTRQACAKYLTSASPLLIDATGRARLFSKLLNLAARRGQRDDSALFAHFNQVPLQHPGNIHVNRLESGWAWRIPLPGKVSVGIVQPVNTLIKYGQSSEQQFEGFIQHDPLLAPLLKDSQRLTSIAKYHNYQLIGEQFTGPGWVSVGDAAGFVDPIFSSGLHLALSGAKLLSHAILRGGSPQQFLAYEKRLQAQIAAWQHLAESFYDGKLFGLTRASKLARQHFPWSYIVPHFEAQLRRVLSGMAATHSYSFRAARFMLGMKSAEHYGQRLRVR